MSVVVKADIRATVETAQTLMNVQTMKRTIATPTLCVTTRTDPTSVVVSVGIREMVKTAQPLLSAALHLVVQTRIACRKVADVLFVNAVPGLRVMATSVQISTNVIMEKILVTSMHFVPTPREVTCVAANRVFRVMAGHA